VTAKPDLGRVGSAETGSREPSPTVSALTGFDPARGDFIRCPAPPLLGGGQLPSEWLLGIAAIDDKKKAHARAREARAIAAWLGRLGMWLRDQAYEVPPAMPMGDEQ
jgi:hypothetical protein